MSHDDDHASSRDSLDLPASMFRAGETVKDFFLTVWRPSTESTRNQAARYSVVDGMALFEGDILLGTEEEMDEAAAARGIGITGAQFRWKNGRVPYVAADAVKDRAEAAIAHWEARTPFRFPKRTNQKDYISFEARDGCFSQVGRQGGKQVISLGTGCSTGSAIHEIGHTLGLWHEQSREDRDLNVKILVENIIPEQLHNFDKHILDGDDLGTYDFGSIMHYPATAFTRNGKPTIVVLKGNKPIGQRNGLSQGDLAAIKMLYPDLHWPAGDEAMAGAGAVAAPA